MYSARQRARPILGELFLLEGRIHLPQPDAQAANSDRQTSPAWRVRGIRGAITAAENTADAIHAATRLLLTKMTEVNEIDTEDITAVLFSVTSDIHAAFPAAAARQLGWVDVPLLDLQEAANPSDLPLCIRVLMLVNTTRSNAEIRHVYEGEAARLRPDLSEERSFFE